MKLYSSYSLDVNTLELCKLHLRVLIAFTTHKTDDIELKFYQLRALEFLIRAVSLEFEMKSAHELRSSKAPSLIQTPATGFHVGPQEDLKLTVPKLKLALTLNEIPKTAPTISSSNETEAERSASEDEATPKNDSSNDNNNNPSPKPEQESAPPKPVPLIPKLRLPRGGVAPVLPRFDSMSSIEIRPNYYDDNAYLNEREQKKIYYDKEIHVSVLMLIFGLMLSQQ